VLALRYVEAAIVTLHAAAAVAYLRRSGVTDVKGLTMALLLAGALISQLIMGLSWSDVEGRFLLPALAPIAYFMVAPVFALLLMRQGSERLAWVYLCLVAAHPWAMLAFV